MPARTCQQRGLGRPTEYPRSLVLLSGALDGLFRQHRLQQSDVARRLEVDPANVSAWCVGKRALPSYWLEPLARVLGISLAEFVRACWKDRQWDGLEPVRGQCPSHGHRSAGQAEAAVAWTVAGRAGARQPRPPSGMDAPPRSAPTR